MDFSKILKLGQSVHCVGFGDATVQQFPEENNDSIVLFFAENNCHRSIHPDGKYINKNSMTAIYPNLDSVKKFYPDAETAWEHFTLNLVELYKRSDQLKPFDRVLVRNYLSEPWIPQIFSYMSNRTTDTNKDRIYFKCIGGSYNYCIPFDESLNGKI